MISIELWRARIGTFNNKRSRSRCSLSSTNFPIYVFFHWTRHRCRNDELSEIQAHISPVASPPPSSLPAEERSPAIETAIPKSGGDRIGDLLSSSSLSLASSSDNPCFLHRSLLREAFIMLVIAIISQLLIMAGDVETNPGPKHRADEKPCLSDLQCMAYTNEEGRDFRLKDRVKPYWRDLAVALKFPQHEIAIMEHKDDNCQVYYLFQEWLRGAIEEKDSKPVTWATLITALKNANIQGEAKILEEHFVEMPHPVPAQQPVDYLTSSACGLSPHPSSSAVSSVDLSGIPDGTQLDIDSHLALLMVALTDIAYQWEHLGTQLGLKYGKLKAIDINKRGIPIDCMREMLAAWLRGSGGVCSKQALKTALQNTGC